MPLQYPLRYTDLFCGIGGFRFAMELACSNLQIPNICVLSSDIDDNCRKAYFANFGETPSGDIAAIPVCDIPDMDFLLAGFPCQPFSIIGASKGFEDARGTLFFEIARILQAKQPTAFVLENVKQLATHDKGNTLRRITQTLDELGYRFSFQILNALDFGLPQKRERIFIVGILKSLIEPNSDFFNGFWDFQKQPIISLSHLLEPNPPKKVFASEYIRRRRLNAMNPTDERMIWHENKSGHISAYPYSCALRASASYNYLLVDGIRRLTPRELLRLQGFPDDFSIVVTEHQLRKQVGNAVPVPVAKAVIHKLLKLLGTTTQGTSIPSKNEPRS